MTATLKDVNQVVVSELLTQIGDSRFELWFSDRDCIRVVNKGLEVIAPDEFSLERIRTQFNDELERSASNVLGEGSSVMYRVETPEVDQSNAGGAESKEESTACLSSPEPAAVANGVVVMEPSTPLARKTIEDFEFGATNPIARTSIEQVLLHPGQITPLIIHGPVGCGKSHLLEALTHQLRRRRGIRKSICITAEQFTSHFIEALNGRGLPVFRRKYRDLDLFAIDDLHFFAGKRATLIEFQYTIDELLRAGKQILVGTERNPAELNFLEPELVNRLNSGMVCGLNYPDKKARIAILKQLCRRRKIELGSDVIAQIAIRLTQDVRQLCGAVNRIHAFQLSSDDQCSAASVDALLDDLYQANEHVMTFSTIENVVCDVCGVEPDDLKSTKRTKRISTARMLAMWLSRKYTKCALSEIGHYYGGRSHSTVISAQKKVEGWIDGNQSIQVSSRSDCNVNETIRRIKSDLRVG